MLSSCTVDGRQMYSGSSVVGKASTIGIEISPTTSLIFTGVAKFGVVSNITQVELSVFENTARYPNSETNFLCGPDALCLPCTPENCWAEMDLVVLLVALLLRPL